MQANFPTVWQERLDREAAEQEARRHRQAVADLKRRGFTDPAMKD